MPIINYKDLKKYIEELGNNPFAPVYLIYGEEMLTQNVFDTLLDVLVPPSERSINYEPLDGTQENIHDVIGRANTYSLLPGIKVIALRDSKIFYAGQDKDRLLDNAKKAYDDDNIKKAAGHLRGLMSLLNLSFEDIGKSNRQNSLGQNIILGADDAWLDEIITYCRENELSVPAAGDDSRTLQLAVEKGFPANNHLIITTDMADKRRSLFKALSNKGVVIDCSVPKGDRRADRVVQESVLADRMNTMLTAGNKSMGQSTYRALYEMTGFDLRAFSSNLEKLISYVGDRQEITITDVESVLQRTKKDPIYELTNALADRKPAPALFFLDSLLSAGIHPLQAFTALINQVRKLLLVKDFVESPLGSDWQAACPYDYFQKRVIPAIVEYDRSLLDHLSGWQTVLKEETPGQKTGTRTKSKKKKSKLTTDLLIAKNPKNAYPIYFLLKKSERFSKEDLIKAFETLNAADKKLKTGGQDARLVLEKVILGICKVQGERRTAQGRTAQGARRTA
ncbi:DNA polymerase III delta subunit (EC [Olavius sp. associated proteobacterium Delta 1]|nr:DNA polymerase III delta subunit (EC [Olavius sp. associated proteobacterium Delta 1]